MKFHRQLLALSLSAALTAGMTITASAQGPVTVSVNGTKSNVSAPWCPQRSRIPWV